jgi:hypothetical protein
MALGRLCAPEQPAYIQFHQLHLMETLKMQTAEIMNNPFAMLTHPADVLKAIGDSDRLSCLARHVCRPLDKPINLRLLPSFVDFDIAIDSESDAEH